MDPKGISVAQRAREFSEEMVTVSAGKLFCSACREELSLKLSILKKTTCSHRNTVSTEMYHKTGIILSIVGKLLSIIGKILEQCSIA